MKNLNKLLKNTLIFAISNFASKFLIFLLLPFYTRVLSVSDFGTGDLIITSVTFLIPMFTLCVSEGALRFALNGNKEKNYVFTFGLEIIFGGFILLILLSPLFKKIYGINNYMFYFYGIYLASSLNQYFNQFTRGIEKIRLIGIVGILGTLTTVSFNILLLAIFKFGIKGYLISYLITNLVCAIILFFCGGLYKYISLRNNKKNLSKEMLSYNIPLIPNRISWWIIMMFNRYAISYYFGFHKVGVFTAANRISSIITAVYGVVQQALLLSVIDEYENESNYNMFIKTYNIMNTVLIMTVSTLNLLIIPLSSFLFPNDYYEAYKIAPLLVVAVLFGSLHGNLTTYFSAVKKTRILFYNSFIGMVLTVVLNMLLIPIFDVYGSAITSTFIYFCIWFHLFAQCRKEVPALKNIKKDLICYLLVIFQGVSVIIFDSPLYCITSTIVILLVILIKIDEIKSIYLLLKILPGMFWSNKIKK